MADLSKYKDYEQCYAEKTASHNEAVLHQKEVENRYLENGETKNKTRRAIGAIFTGMGQGLSGSSQRQMHCMTTGGGGFYNTNCR